MAIETHNWTMIKDQSLATAARQVGFDLAMYEQYPKKVKDELRKQSVKRALKNIEDAYEEATEEYLSDVIFGVYAIRLSKPLTVMYQLKPSQVVYIGRGNVSNRIKQHLNDKLFDFMQSLSGANFDFQILNVVSSYESAQKLHKQIEYDLLKEFASTVTGESRGFPLLNKNAGTSQNVDKGPKWDHPLRKSSSGIEWELKPTDYWRNYTLS